MTLEALAKVLAARKAQAETEKLGFLERLGIAEGVAMTCQFVLEEMNKPDPIEPKPVEPKSD